jgi:hypothetical protein
MSFSAMLRDDSPVQADPARRHRASRHGARLAATASIRPDHDHPVVVHNISRTGAMFEAQEDLPEEGHVVLDVPGIGAVAASIVWRSANLYACRFDGSVDELAIRNKIASEKVVWGRFAGADHAPRTPPARTLTGPVPTFAPDLLAAPAAARVPDDERWPVPVRVAVIVAAALVCWVIPALLLAWLIG